MVRSSLLFSTENDHSDLPYTDDVTIGPVSEETSSESFSSSPSQPSSVAESPFQLPRQKSDSERARMRLNQVQTQLNFLLDVATNPPERVLTPVPTLTLSRHLPVWLTDALHGLGKGNTNGYNDFAMEQLRHNPVIPLQAAATHSSAIRRVGG